MRIRRLYGRAVDCFCRPSVRQEPPLGTYVCGPVTLDCGPDIARDLSPGFFGGNRLVSIGRWSGKLMNAVISSFPYRIIAPRIGCALLVFITVAFPAVAQTTATPGGVTSNGVVALGTGNAAASSPILANPSASSPILASPAASSPILANPAASTPSTAGTTTTGGSGSGSAGGVASSGGNSSTLGNAGATPSSAAVSRGSSATAATAPSSSAPAWALCPPSGASGLQPFLTGTDISCAP